VRLTFGCDLDRAQNTRPARCEGRSRMPSC